MKRSKSKRLRIFFYVLLLMLMGLSVYAVKLAMKDVDNSNATTSKTDKTFTSSLQTFSAPLYSFQANKSWRLDDKNSNQTQQIYRLERNGLLQKQLTVSSGSVMKPVNATHVVPIEQRGNRMVPGMVSEHCGQQSGFKGTLLMITVSSIQVPCLADSRLYIVAVGEKGKGTILDIKRPNGEVTPIMISYQDVTATPNAKEFESIVSSLQIK